jgi:hypothetical protein
MKLMALGKVYWVVTPAKAGVQKILKCLDSGFRRNDAFYGISTLSEFIKIDQEGLSGMSSFLLFSNSEFGKAPKA